MLLAVKCPAIGFSLTGTILVSIHLGYYQLPANPYLVVVFEVLEHFQCPATSGYIWEVVLLIQGTSYWFYTRMPFYSTDVVIFT